MKKYSFLVFHQDYSKFLDNIRGFGVLHVIEKDQGEFEDPSITEKYKLITEYKNTLNFIEPYTINEELNETISGVGIDVLKEIKGIQHDIEYYHHQIAMINKELAQAAPWGEYSLKTIKNLSANQVNLSFFTCSVKKFNPEWEENYSIEKISVIGSQLYFVVVHKPNEKVNIDAEVVSLPEKSLKDLRENKKSFEEHIENAEAQLKTLSVNHIVNLKASLRQLQSELDLQKVELNTDTVAEEKVKLLEGWVPDDKASEINKFLENALVYYEVEKPTEEDKVPIKLKNSAFSKLYEPIGELYTLPEYKELDLTPYFAPWYMLFFGFCLGDAGYGLLITIGTIIGLMKAPAKVKPFMKLGMFLGIATTIMGIVGGTFFGIMLHPADYKSAFELPGWIQNYQQFIVSSNNLMKIALAIGYLQVIFGMFLNAANRIKVYGFKYAISQFGWNVIVLISLPAFALYAVPALQELAIIPEQTSKLIFIVSAVIGGIPAFFYNSPGKNPLINFGAGLWEFYGVASGLLGDVLSYIRLFALGLSSAILGNVFNQLAMQSKEGVGNGIAGILVMVLILAFGHSLNFFMAALGSFVHPLRLTFVEFYKNAGFMGGGKKYEPFSK